MGFRSPGADDAATALASYLIVSDGTTVTGYDHTGAVLSSGADGGAVLQAVFNAIPAVGADIEFRNDGNLFPWRTVPLIPAAITGLLQMRGNGSTVQTKVAAGYALVGLNRTADYQTFQNIAIRDFTVDRNNIDGGGENGVVCHFEGQRINLDRITFQNIRSINVPAGAANAQIHYNLNSKHVGAGETQTNITNVYADLIDMAGGDQGFIVIGSCAATTCEVFHDVIEVTRWKWNAGATPTVGGSGAGVQVGSKGFGNRCVTRDGNVLNSNDVGVEIDSMEHATVENIEATDCLINPFLFRNFHAPPVASEQVGIWRNCTARYVSIIPTAAKGIVCFRANNTSGVVSTYGRIIVKDCDVYAAATAFDGLNGFVLSAPGQLNSLVIDGLNVSIPGISDTSAGAVFNNMIVINPPTQCVLKMDKVRYVLAGATTNNTARFRAFVITGNGNELYMDIADVDLDCNITGFGAGFSNGMLLGSSTGTMAGTIRRVRFIRWTDDTAPNAIVVTGTATLTIDGKIQIEECDFEGIAGGGNEISVGTGQSTKVFARFNHWRNLPGPSTLTGLVTAVGSALGTAFPVVVAFKQGTGTLVTAIDVSTNAGGSYRNIVTQAAGVVPVGTDVIIGPLPTDALIKVTFGVGTQPTIDLLPCDP